MVAYLEKSEGSEGFHQIIDFLTISHIKNALTEFPTLYASPIEQFWQTAALSTNEDEAAPMPHESPLQSVYSLGHDKGSLSLNELMDLCTSLSKKAKKLEQTIKTRQAKRRAKVVISVDEEAEEDHSN
ncbi:hypothetical protein Tco_1578372 [Tanacetum coccineum]